MGKGEGPPGRIASLRPFTSLGPSISWGNRGGFRDQLWICRCDGGTPSSELLLTTHSTRSMSTYERSLCSGCYRCRSAFGLTVSDTLQSLGRRSTRHADCLLRHERAARGLPRAAALHGQLASRIFIAGTELRNRPARPSSSRALAGEPGCRLSASGSPLRATALED